MIERVHTFLFIDLAGYTAMTEALGDERAAEMATQFCETVRVLLPVPSHRPGENART